MKSAHPGAASCRAGVRVAADQRRAVSELFAHVEITMFAGRSGQTSVVSIASLSARSLQFESQRWTSPSSSSSRRLRTEACAGASQQARWISASRSRSDRQGVLSPLKRRDRGRGRCPAMLLQPRRPDHHEQVRELGLRVAIADPSRRADGLIPEVDDVGDLTRRRRTRPRRRPVSSKMSHGRDR